MKSFLFLLFILASTFSYSQESIHFLFTTEGNYQISEPLCSGMIEESNSWMKNEIKKIQAAKKSGEYNIKKASIQELANYEVIQKQAENPKDYFPIYSPIGDIYREYNDLFEDNVFMSLQEVALKELGKPNIQIGIRNVVVNPSTTSLDMDIIDLNKVGVPKVSKHFSCATGRLLAFNPKVAQWFFFWQQFYEEVAYKDWLQNELYKINSKLISEKQRNEIIEAKLSELGIGTESYVKERVALLIDKLSGFPIDNVSLEKTQGILVSTDQSKFLVFTLSEPQILSAWPDSESNLDTIEHFETTSWLFKFNPTGEIQYGFYDNNYITSDQTKTQLNKFYSATFTPAPDFSYNEELWTTNLLEDMIDILSLFNLNLRHESQSKESSDLIQTYIKPYLKESTTQESSQYNNYYQRITADNINEYNFDVETKPSVVKDYLLSNPEKTAFIYPVLLQHRSVQEREYYYTQEDFKFYVLLKNEQGTFDLYDWHYFSALPYKNYYSLLTCAHYHLEKISNWDGESDIINDPAFWNNFIVKKSDRGFEYLTMFTSREQSPMVARPEFEAQVKDCYKLLSEQDVADLYPNQLKQVILCLNTIQTYNLKGNDETQLATLATQIYFEKRLNKVQKFDGHYYPMLHLEFGGNLEAHSYYQLK
jgi:hypothetical protein